LTYIGTFFFIERVSVEMLRGLASGMGIAPHLRVKTGLRWLFSGVGIAPHLRVKTGLRWFLFSGWGLLLTIESRFLSEATLLRLSRRAGLCENPFGASWV